MRIVQIIDSLEAGGAERMAVNYANGLAEIIEFSGLISTRNEGNLLYNLNSSVNYLFLNKKSALDFSALYRLKKYCKLNKIEFVHAHSSSFFIAFLKSSNFTFSISAILSLLIFSVGISALFGLLSFLLLLFEIQDFNINPTIIIPPIISNVFISIF